MLHIGIYGAFQGESYTKVKKQRESANALKIGDKFIVLTGEPTPTEGHTIEGISTLDESPVTGESVPVNKKVGDKVFAAII